MTKLFSPKPLGLILREAGLITPAQIEVALQDQKYYQLPFGEILALHGWIQQETADFFAEIWPTVFIASYLYPLGHYLQSAALLNERQIQVILEEQKQLGIRFGALAVLKGWVSQTTINYFLENLVSDAKSISDFQCKTVKNTTTSSNKHKELILPSSSQNTTKSQEQTLFMSESTIYFEDSLLTFPTDEENFDLAQCLDYHLAFPE